MMMLCDYLRSLWDHYMPLSVRGLRSQSMSMAIGLAHWQAYPHEKLAHQQGVRQGYWETPPYATRHHIQITQHIFKVSSA
jgi:hypothetical protein